MNYVVLVLTIILVISLTLNKSLYDERNTLSNTLAIEKSNNLHLTESIDKQNKTTLELKVDYDNAKNILIEYDGEFHYQISRFDNGFDKFVGTKIRDTIKK